MLPRITNLTFAAVLLASLPAGAAIDLQPLDDANATPYHAIRVTVRNDFTGVIDALQFRMKEGGPTFRQPVLIPAGAAETFTIALPALSPQQTYQVLAPTVNSREIQDAWISVSLPPESIHAADVVNPSLYADFEGAFAGFGPDFLGQVFLSAVVLCVLLAATLLIRRPALRVVAALLIAAAATAAFAALAARQPTLLEKTIADANSPTIILVAARRSTAWRHTGRLLPIYANAASLATDNTVIEGPLLRTDVAPDSIRLFIVRE